VAIGDASTQVVLLDIEGTTTPVSFVHEGLFPFARRGAAAFLEAEGGKHEVLADLALLRQERSQDQEAGLEPPAFGPRPVDAVGYLHWLIDQDRKSTGLKSLQGKIWAHGYRSGELKGEVYPDVPLALERWSGQGRRVCIYSSGSVLAQQLLFGHSTAGDLTPRIHAYFDTTTGPKKVTSSYQAIAGALETEPGQILFLSDVIAELDAAREAGFQIALSVRPGHAAPQNPSGYPELSDFSQVLP
jgi:enolase-phosphatase E1